MSKIILFDMEGTLVDSAKPVAGIESALRSLAKKNFKMFVVTSAFSVAATTKLSSLRLIPYFEKIYGASPNSLHESKGDLIKQVMNEYKFDPLSVVFIGDRDVDILGARANGIRSIGVTWGFGSMNDFANAGADFVIDRPEQLIPLLETFCGFATNPNC